MADRLTEGAIAMISTGQWETADIKPVLQLTELRVVSTQNSSAGGGGNTRERYRIMLSDGSFLQQGMLATQLNDLVKSQQLQRGSIIQLTDYVRNTIQDRVILIVTHLELILPICDIIGQPKQFPVRSGSEPPSPIQPFNQQPTIINPPQTYMGTSPVPRPTNSPIYPQHDHNNTGTYSYGYNNSMNNPHSVPPVSRSPTTTSIRPVHLQQTYNQQPPYTNRGPTSKTEPPRIIPIQALNPYQSKWTLKARVTSKAELRHYNNAKGDGKVFSFDLLDASGGEIRVTCFNTVADQFYNQIETGKIYYISKGSVKPASKAYNHLKNEHEILLDNSSTIQTCFEDDTSIPHQQFHFRQISEIEGLENNSVLDVIGVVSSITPSSTITRKNGTEAVKRTLQLKDMSGRNVEVTLWGNFCTNEGQTLQSILDSGTFPIIAIKSARVSDFNGKTIGTISTSQLLINPDFPECQKLKTWFGTIGKTSPSISLTTSRPETRKTISQIKEEKLGTNEKPDWITITATIMNVKVETFCYTACPILIGDRKCSKKVTNNGDGKWRCDRCDQSVDECDYRYILNVCIMDHTGSIWVTAFQESGEEITGVSAKELYGMKYEDGDDEKFTEIIRNVLHARFCFKLKVKEESYNDEVRVKSTVVKAEKVKSSSDTSFYLDLIKKEENKNASFVVPKGETVIPSNTGFVGQQMGQYGNQYVGSRVGGGCNSCGGVGHTSVNCPSIGSGQGYSQGGRVNSYGVSNATSAYGGGGGTGGGGGGGNECFKCHQYGHWARDCPNSGGGNVGQGRYGGGSGQYVGGY